MLSGFRRNFGKSSLTCRRKGDRYPLPVEVAIEVASRTIRGIVRDITIDKDRGTQAVGISLMHFEPLSVGREYLCQTVKKNSQLPDKFFVSVRWCRYFEDEAFISGGVVNELPQ